MRRCARDEGWATGAGGKPDATARPASGCTTLR